jgi:predicted amidophosphoribosyltransferase
MSPRILDTRRCPHCKADLPDPTPRVCPSCGGSLQQRHLKIGCLTSAPKLFLIAAGAWALREYLLHVLRG